MQVNLRGIITMSNMIERGLFAIFNNKDNIVKNLSKLVSLFLTATLYTIFSILGLELFSGETELMLIDDLLVNLHLYYFIGILVMITVSALRGLVPMVSSLLDKTKAKYIDWMNNMKADRDMRHLQEKQRVIEMESQPTNTYCTDCGIIINNDIMAQRAPSHYKREEPATIVIQPSVRAQRESHYKKKASVSHYKTPQFRESLDNYSEPVAEPVSHYKSGVKKFMGDGRTLTPMTPKPSTSFYKRSEPAKQPSVYKRNKLKVSNY